MLDRINANPNYSPEYKAKLIAAYRFFKEQGHEFTEHGLNRALNPKRGTGKQSFTLIDVLQILKRPPNYTDGAAKAVRFYDDLAVIQANDTGEVISVISTTKQSASWEEITNADE